MPALPYGCAWRASFHQARRRTRCNAACAPAFGDNGGMDIQLNGQPQALPDQSTLASLLASLKAQGLLSSDTQALGQLVEQITLTLLFSLDYQRIIGSSGEIRLVVYQVMMLVAPHLTPAPRHTAEQLAQRYLQA